MIRNIIFDFGGVILNINYLHVINNFKNLGITNFDKIFSQAKQNNLFDMLDKGEISGEMFRDQIRELTGLNLTNELIDSAWNSMLFDLPKERIQLLNKVKKHYRTFLLSNTNSIHYPIYMGDLEKKHGIKCFSELFEKYYLSFEIGKRKPDPESFTHVLEDSRLIPEETLFIDDLMHNIEGAKTTGMQAYWLNISQEDLLDLFDKEGKLTV